MQLCLNLSRDTCASQQQPEAERDLINALGQHRYVNQ